jgi:hypothetical protein
MTDRILLNKNFRASTDNGQVFYWVLKNFKNNVESAVGAAVKACYYPMVLMYEGASHESVQAALRVSAIEFECWLKRAGEVQKFDKSPPARVPVRVCLTLDSSDVGRCLKWLISNDQVDIERRIVDAVCLFFLAVSKASWGIGELTLIIDTARLGMQQKLDLPGYESPSISETKVVKTEVEIPEKIPIPVGESRQVDSAWVPDEPEIELNLDYEF